MARVKYGAIVTSISGKVGGSVFQNCNGVSTLKNKSNVINEMSKKRNRNLLISNSNQQINFAWSNLTQLQRNAWISFANFIKIPQSHNAGLFLSGQSLFYQVNFYRLFYGHELTHIIQQARCINNPITMTFALYGGQLNAFLSRNTNSTNEFIMIKATSPLSNGTYSFKNRLKTLIFNTGNNAQININQAYIDKFGFAPSVGQLIGFSYTSMSLLNGFFYAWSESRTTIVEMLQP